MGAYLGNLKKIAEKYSNLENQLKFEEGVAINFHTANFLKTNSSSQEVLKRLNSIKDDYKITRQLLSQQRLDEEEAALSTCKGKSKF